MKKVKALIILAFCCGLYFLGVLVCMHIVRRDLNPYATPISYYRASPTSYILSSAFVAGAVGEFIIFDLLRYLPAGDKKTISKWGRGLLFAAATAFFVTGIFKLGTAHWLGALLHTLLFPVAVTLIGYSMRADVTKRLSLIVGVMTTVMLLTLSEAFDGNSLFHPYFGMLEKVDIVLMMLWCFMILTAIYTATQKSTFDVMEETQA